MAIDLDPQQFAALRQHFQAVCEAQPQVQSARVAELASAEPALAAALAELLAALDPTDLVAADDLGGVFGPFRVVRPLGSGGMGEVFLAERREQGFEQQVALKFVHRLARSPEATRRFLRERQLLARLDHPGIARLVDGGLAADGRPWLAMEFVDGLGLQAHAQRHGLDIRARVALFRGLCAAVAYAHRHLIVHRDIKPANVLVTEDGTTKLLDFGIARLLDDSDSESTGQGARALTLRYAAPEQVAGDRCSTATDVYALGVLLFELVSGGTPYEAAAASGDWGNAVLTEAPRPLLRVLADGGRGLSGSRQRRELAELDRILRKAMAKSPNARYTAVQAFDADLEDWLARRPLRSGISGARAQTLHLIRRLRWPLALAAAIVVALGAGLLVARQQALAAQREAAAARAHLDAVLDVLGAANPGRFAGREPTASEFLVTAARQIEEGHAERPALRRRALLEVGHGLLNLGKSREAEAVLGDALAAAMEDPAATAAERLAILGLMVESQDAPGSQAARRRSALQIEQLARLTPTDVASAVDALTRAAAALARQGDFAEAERLFELAQARLERWQGPVSKRENFWRQRGWAALRANQPDAASRFLGEADRVIQSFPDAFGSLRRAEGLLLQAQAALLGGQAATARRYLDAARPAHEAEYASGHPEAAALRLLEAQLALLEARWAQAHALATTAIAGLVQAADGYRRDIATARLVQAVALAGLGACADAQVALAAATADVEQLTPLLPRERGHLARTRRSVEEKCTEAASRGRAGGGST
jgi:eukaryotic-like serine/threonine-protein kinase